jgi:spermidine/putrescine ABC transporter ATP-binding subunit
VTPSSERAVELVNVSKFFGEVKAVDAVSLVVGRGSFFSLLGPSGCGKSTTLRLISGFETPDEGQLLIEGQDVSRVPPYRRPTNMVFQRWALFPHMSVFENVAFGLKVERVASGEISRRVGAALELVGLHELARRRPGQLSGGQMQRVALARALVKKPKVLLLDEPLGALDLKLRLQMQLELKRIQRETGTTFVYVTHDQGEAMTMSDGIAVMNGGRVEQVGSPQEIYDHPATRFVAGFIGNTNLIDVDVRDAGNGQATLVAGRLSFRVPAAAGTSAGQRAALSLRYERVRVGKGTDLLPNTYEARVRDVIFSGSTVHYLLALDGAPIELTAEVTYDGVTPVLNPGDATRVGWEPASGLLLTE